MATGTQAETGTRPDYTRMAEDFRVLGDGNRLRILRLLASGPMSVTELIEGSGLARPSINDHLSTLRLSRAVEAKRGGKRVYYSLVAGRFADCAAILSGSDYLTGSWQGPMS